MDLNSEIIYICIAIGTKQDSIFFHRELQEEVKAKEKNRTNRGHFNINQNHQEETQQKRRSYVNKVKLMIKEGNTRYSMTETRGRTENKRNAENRT